MEMGSADNDVNEAIAEFQRRAREMLLAQQEAFLAAVRAWREGAGKGAAPWPEPNPPGLSPKPEELAEASYAFAAKLLADQSRFMQELSKTMAKRNEKDS
jgi:hypothetical protein